MNQAQASLRIKYVYFIMHSKFIGSVRQTSLILLYGKNVYNCMVCGIGEDFWNDLWNGMFMKFTAKKM